MRKLTRCTHRNFEFAYCKNDWAVVLKRSYGCHYALHGGMSLCLLELSHHGYFWSETEVINLKFGTFNQSLADAVNCRMARSDSLNFLPVHLWNWFGLQRFIVTPCCHRNAKCIYLPTSSWCMSVANLYRTLLTVEVIDDRNRIVINQHRHK